MDQELFRRRALALIASGVLVVGGSAVAGCGDDDGSVSDDIENAADDAGDQLDQAGESLDDAADDAQDQLDEAGDTLDDAANDAQEGVEGAVEDAQNEISGDDGN